MQEPNFCFHLSDSFFLNVSLFLGTLPIGKWVGESFLASKQKKVKYHIDFKKCEFSHVKIILKFKLKLLSYVSQEFYFKFKHLFPAKQNDYEFININNL